jgi:hypothetical protein
LRLELLRPRAQRAGVKCQGFLDGKITRLRRRFWRVQGESDIQNCARGHKNLARTCAHARAGRPTSRDFVPWHFSDAARIAPGRPCQCRRPRNLHNSGHFGRYSPSRSGRMPIWPRQSPYYLSRPVPGLYLGPSPRVRRSAARCGRRAAKDPMIGHMTSDHRMGRNYLEGRHAWRSCQYRAQRAGYNFTLLLQWLERHLRTVVMALWRVGPQPPASPKSAPARVLHGRLLIILACDRIATTWSRLESIRLRCGALKLAYRVAMASYADFSVFPTLALIRLCGPRQGGVGPTCTAGNACNCWPSSPVRRAGRHSSPSFPGRAPKCARQLHVRRSLEIESCPSRC